jgi:uncharacterized membrane protein
MTLHLKERTRDAGDSAQAAMRTQEIHPALVHLPIALAPAALAVEAAGSATGDAGTRRVGRWLSVAAAVAVVPAAIAGLVAQGSIRRRGQAHRMLITHRNLNALVTLALTALGVSRLRGNKAEPLYFVGATAAVGTMVYTGYLGGKLVYEHGLGVVPAGTVEHGRAPTLTSPATAARQSAANAVKAVGHAIHHLKEGKVAPSLLGAKGDEAKRA